MKDSVPDSVELEQSEIGRARLTVVPDVYCHFLGTRVQRNDIKASKHNSNRTYKISSGTSLVQTQSSQLICVEVSKRDGTRVITEA